MVDRTPVPQAIARDLQDMIRNGAFRADEKLPSQRVLSSRPGVSRPSLREALMTLETLGLIRTYPGRGTFVSGPGSTNARPSAQWRYAGAYSMRDVFELRTLLEARLARHAAQTTGPGDIAALIAATDRMEGAWERGDLVAHVEADLDFHRHIAKKSPNPLLLRTYDWVGALLAETQRQPVPFTPAGRMSQSIAEHRRIVAAFCDRDADAAEGAMIDHIRNTAACAGIEM